MKMSTFANEVLDKEMLVNLLLHSSCEFCPFRKACQEYADEEPEITCDQFLDRYIVDDRNEG